MYLSVKMKYRNRWYGLEETQIDTQRRQLQIVELYTIKAKRFQETFQSALPSRGEERGVIK